MIPNFSILFCIVRSVEIKERKKEKNYNFDIKSDITKKINK